MDNADADGVDETILMAAVVWSVPTAIVLIFDALLFEVMQGVVVFSLFVLPTAILWSQVLMRKVVRRTRGQVP